MPKRRRGLPKYVYEETHRGSLRLRFRRARFTYDFRHRIGTEAFEQEYTLCRKGQRPDAHATIGETVAESGTMNSLVEYYYHSHAFKSLKPDTQRDYKCVIDQFRETYGNTAVTDYDYQTIDGIISNRAKVPAQANKLLKRLRMLFKLAIRLKWCTTDPTDGVKQVKTRSGGFPTWMEEDVQKFEDHFPSGSQARLAFALLIYTGARRSDVVRFGRQNVKDGRISFKAKKNGRMVSVRIHPGLQKELDQVPSDQMQFLLTGYGKSFSGNGFGNKMRKWCRDAGLKDRSSHGLRKAIGRRLAEAGATEHEISAILGVSLRTAGIYTAAANKVHLAGTGMAKLSD